MFHERYMLPVEIGVLAGCVAVRYNDVLRIGSLAIPKVLLNPLIPCIFVTILLNVLY